ncbi:polymorphic toxin type 22 domain-containing protein [Burkholderia sp. SRS-W-2-2016]|uniref:polymorphic toxin type 22 domain-containing protein n=1 Tax=Burkholderia sp. SRS-W-2-2016 TaxID=1926878 RepID=UPI00117BEE87
MAKVRDAGCSRMFTYNVDLPKIAPLNVNAFLAITHAYGGNTALEVGVAPPGSTSFGVAPFSHSIPISGSKEN